MTETFQHTTAITVEMNSKMTTVYGIFAGHD